MLNLVYHIMVDFEWEESTATDPNDYGSLPSIKPEDPKEVLRRKRNRRYRYLREL